MPETSRYEADPALVALADEWGKAARTEVDHVKRAIAVAAHARCLRLLRAARNGVRA